MLSCLFYICSSNFPIHIWNKAQQGKWKILHFWWADVKMPSFTFGEYMGSTLSIRGRPLFAYPISWNFHDIKFFTTLIFTTLTFFYDIRLFSGDFHDAHLFSRHWKFYAVLIWKLWFFSRCCFTTFSQIYEISRRFHDFFTTFAASSASCSSASNSWIHIKPSSEI